MVKALTARKIHHCINCGELCPGLNKSYCSEKCRNIVFAAKAQAKRDRGGSKLPPRPCEVCGKPFQPRGVVKTCSQDCREVLEARNRKQRNAEYHQNVRKDPNSGVRTWSDWANEGNRRQELAKKAQNRRDSDPENSRQINRKWRVSHRKRALEMTNRWKRANPDKVKVHARKYYQTHIPKFRLHGLRRKLRMKSNGVTNSKANILFELMLRDGVLCAYCERDIQGKGQRHLDHLIPVRLGGLTTADNMLISCQPCNHAKSDKDPVEWIKASGYEKRFSERFPETWAALQTWQKDRNFSPLKAIPMTEERKKRLTLYYRHRKPGRRMKRRLDSAGSV